MSQSGKNSVRILGTRLDQSSWDSVLQFCKEALSGKTAKQIVTLNGEIALQAEQNKTLQETINNADLVIADSTNIYIAAWLRGMRRAQIVPGSALTIELCKLAAEMNKKVFLLGAGKGVAEKAGERLHKQIPGLQIIGTSSEDPDLIIGEDVAKTSADIVFVAYGAPKQEFWIKRNKDTSAAKILIGVGGTFDMIAGTLPRAPHALQILHLEWLWRLFIQPTRIHRIIKALIVFPFKAFLNQR